jgi:transaldolase/transaldolase/glucose-6-phosphate isomerase
VEALIGPDTINTLPIETIDAFRDHGKVQDHLENNLVHAKDILEKLKENDIDIDQVTQKLENEGVEKFNKSYGSLLKAIESKRKKQTA